jgi:uncharacterized protein DUF4824
MKRRGLLAAAALVVVANAIALLGVAPNRASTLQTIELTQRELILGYQSEENSGIDLQLVVNNQSTLDWFDAAKLQELGFPASVASVTNYRDWPALSAYVAFEYDGPAWQAVAAKEREFQRQFQARPIESNIESNIDGQSHLVPVDASGSFETLLAKYGSTGTHLILRATVLPLIGRKAGIDVMGGRIVELINPQIHVPLPAALDLEKLKPPYLPSSQRARYTVRLAYGTRFEPWVVSVTALPK